jgi:hypothetical protein
MDKIRALLLWFLTIVKDSFHDWPHFIGGILLWMIVVDKAGLASIADQVGIYNDVVTIPAFLYLAWMFLLLISALRDIGKVLAEWILLEPLTATVNWLKDNHAR